MDLPSSAKAAQMTSWWRVLTSSALIFATTSVRFILQQRVSSDKTSVGMSSTIRAANPKHIYLGRIDLPGKALLDFMMMTGSESLSSPSLRLLNIFDNSSPCHEPFLMHAWHACRCQKHSFCSRHL